MTSRRHVLLAAGAATAGGLAGCLGRDDHGPAGREFALSLDGVDQGLVEHALHRPDPDDPLDGPARTALDAILPEGRHVTRGYEPLSQDAYVTDGERYYQVMTVTTDRETVERRVVRASPVPEDADVADPVALDELPRVNARVVEILSSHHLTDGQGPEDLLRDGGYVLRRPVERESRLADDLDGRVVTMEPDAPLRYRLEVGRERVAEPVHETVALRVADSREDFREIVRATRVDRELAPSDLGSESRDRLRRAIGNDPYRERTPLSEPYESLLAALGLAEVEDYSQDNLLLYDGELYRYVLAVDTVE